MILETDRIILRPWSIEDAESLYFYASDPKVGPMDGWPPHISLKNSREVIEKNLMKEDYFALCLSENNKAIGCVGLMGKEESTFDLNDNEAELGFWIGKPFWNQGITTEAAMAMLDFGFNVLELEAAWAGFYVGNTGAKRILEKCGFKYQLTELRSYVKLMCEYRSVEKYKLKREEFIL